MKYLYLAVALLAISMSSMSQYYTQTQEPAYKGSIRFNLLGLIDPFDNNISLGGEYYVHPRWSVTTDLAYVFFSEYLSQNKRTSGYMVKPGIRYYTSENRKGFLEAVAFFKHVGYSFEDWLGKDCIEGVPTYEEYQKFTLVKSVMGINMQAGGAANLTKDNSLRVEFYGGLGVRFKWQHIRNEPDACYQRNSFFRSNVASDFYAVPSLPLGVRLVYRLE